MTKEEAKEKIKEAAYTIKHDGIKLFVLNTLNFIPEGFYIVPSSSTGQYHPKDENCEGGLVIHTLKTLKVLDTMSRMYDFNDYELDLARAALLLHDSCKNGKVEYGKWTVFDHPILAAELAIESNPHNEVIGKAVAKLIKSHMGKWITNDKVPNIVLQRPKTKLQKFVAECDYIASRKDFNISLE